jgi:hypothetical protein
MVFIAGSCGVTRILILAFAERKRVAQKQRGDFAALPSEVFDLKPTSTG